MEIPGPNPEDIVDNKEINKDNKDINGDYNVDNEAKEIKEEHLKEKKDECLVQADGFICEICCKVFIRVEQLNEHRKKVHSEKRYACHLCDKVCKSKDAIKKHQAVHTGERKYMCTHCGKSFADPSSRNQHEKYQHPSEENKIVCKECGKQFKYPRNLKLHMVHHNQSTPYDGKKKQYSNEFKVEALKWVTEIGAYNTAVKFNVPYSCVRNWVSAMKSSYPCTVCEKTFHSKQRLDDHHRTHHNSNSMMKGRGYRFPVEFKKEVADFAANSSTREACNHFGLGESTVRGFIKLLTNPLQCTHCDRKCKNQSQLDKHMDEVHKIGTERPYVPKQESLTQYMENENINTQSLKEAVVSKLREQEESFINPNNIEVYDPNVDGRSKNAKKVLEKDTENKEVDTKNSMILKENAETKIEENSVQSQHSVFDTIFTNNDNPEDCKMEPEVELKEELMSENEEYESNPEDNEQYSDDDTANVDERLDEDTIYSFMSSSNNIQHDDDEARKDVGDPGTQVKSERKSIDINQSENVDNITCPGEPITYRYTSPKEELKQMSNN